MSKNEDNTKKEKSILIVIACDLGLRLVIWVAGPVLLACFAGKFMDNYFNMSGPVFFTSFIGLAFLVSCVGMVKESLRAMQQIDGDEKPEKKSVREASDNDEN